MHTSLLSECQAGDHRRLRFVMSLPMEAELEACFSLLRRQFAEVEDSSGWRGMCAHGQRGSNHFYSITRTTTKEVRCV